MTQQPSTPGRFHRFLNDLKTTKPPNADYTEEGIASNSIKVVADKRLEQRLTEYYQLLDLYADDIDYENLECLDYIEELTAQLQCINLIIMKTSAVYATAGDNPKMSKLFYGWDGLYGNWISKCRRVKRFFADEDPEDNRINIQNLHDAFNHILIKEAFNVLCYCFKDKDVRARSVTVYQLLTANPRIDLAGGVSTTNPAAPQQTAKRGRSEDV